MQQKPLLYSSFKRYRREKMVLLTPVGVEVFTKKQLADVSSWGQMRVDIEMWFLYVPAGQRLPCCLRKPVCISHAMQSRWNTLDGH